MDAGAGGSGEGVPQPGHAGQRLGPAAHQERGEDHLSARECRRGQARPAAPRPRAGLRVCPAGRAGGDAEAAGGQPRQHRARGLGEREDLCGKCFGGKG